MKNSAIKIKAVLSVLLCVLGAVLLVSGSIFAYTNRQNVYVQSDDGKWGMMLLYFRYHEGTEIWTRYLVCHDENPPERASYRCTLQDRTQTNTSEAENFEVNPTLNFWERLLFGGSFTAIYMLDDGFHNSGYTDVTVLLPDGTEYALPDIQGPTAAYRITCIISILCAVLLIALGVVSSASCLSHLTIKEQTVRWGKALGRRRKR